MIISSNFKYCFFSSIAGKIPYCVGDLTVRNARMLRKGFHLLCSEKRANKIACEDFAMFIRLVKPPLHAHPCAHPGQAWTWLCSGPDWRERVWFLFNFSHMNVHVPVTVCVRVCVCFYESVSATSGISFRPLAEICK